MPDADALDLFGDQPATLTHRELCVLGWRFLRSGRRRCTVAVVEPVTAAYCSPDAIGWGYRGDVHVVEAKRSRADFRADAHKPSRRADSTPGDYRWYVAPARMIQPAELPEGWGLAEVTVAADGSARIRVRVEAPQVEMTRTAQRQTMLITGSVMRRLADGGRIDPETGRLSTWDEIRGPR